MWVVRACLLVLVVTVAAGVSATAADLALGTDDAAEVVASPTPSVAVTPVATPAAGAAEVSPVVTPGASAGTAQATPATDASAVPTPSASPPYVNHHPERELLLVVELCRHGDRTPLAEFPNDALPASKWPEGVGELTALGQRAQYDLGRRLRARYVDTGFLPYSWTPAEMYIRSTTIDRTLMSAYSQFAGLYPAGTGSMSDVRTRYGGTALGENEGGLPSRWQPVPIHSEVLSSDGLLIPGGNCPRHAKLMIEKGKDSEWTSRVQEEEQFLLKLGTIVGSKTKLSLRQVNDINDIWVVYESHGVPLPSGVTPEIRKKTHEIATWLLLYGNKGEEVHRLRAGNLLREVAARMKLSSMKDAGTLAPEMVPKVRKFALYSAHDTTLASTLSAMNVKYDTNPPYNSTILWELYRDKTANTYLVHVEYNGESKAIPGCPDSGADDHACKLDDYLEATSSVTFRSEAERVRECLTGVQRQLAFLRSWFHHDAVDDLDPGSGGPSSSPSAKSLAAFKWLHLSVAVTIAGIALVLVYKARSKYREYFAVQSDESESLATGSQAVLERRTDKGILL